MKNKLFVYSAVLFGILFFSAYAGYLSAEKNPERAGVIFEKLKNEFEPILNLPLFLLPIAIFANNAIKSFLLILSGVAFGIIPVLFVAYNGYIIGIVISIAGGERGVGNVLLSLLPHGVFEIPAVILSGALGIWLGSGMIERLRGRDGDLKWRLGYSIRIFLRVAVPMLLIASIIETFISPYISSM